MPCVDPGGAVGMPFGSAANTGGTYETPDATRILTLLWEDVESAANRTVKRRQKRGKSRHPGALDGRNWH